MADESIGAIVIQIDSPGGNVAGTPEVARKIYEARGKGKAIIAQADSLMASAAYYIGAAADEIVATPSSEVGSIGVYAVHEDASGYERAGRI
jgi:ClpP class serine protease